MNTDKGKHNTTAYCHCSTQWTLYNGQTISLHIIIVWHNEHYTMDKQYHCILSLFDTMHTDNVQTISSAYCHCSTQWTLDNGHTMSLHTVIVWHNEH